MTGHIRWEPTVEGDSLIGYVDTLEPDVFLIWHANAGAGEWRLTSDLPGQNEYHLYRDGIDILKAEAERWLEEFVSSLGAVFPDRLRADIARERDMYCGIAAQREQEGRELQAERLHKYVDGLDRALALLDRMAPETTTPTPGRG